MLAQRLKPAERLDFEQAVTELERAVEVALDVIARGERGTNDDAFVNTVLARVAERVRSDDLDGGAQAIDAALAEIEARYRRSQTTLLEEGVKVDTLRRDAASGRPAYRDAGRRRSSDRPARLAPGIPRTVDGFTADGETRGINFSLSVAIELARRMVATARDDADERGTAAVLARHRAVALGERESGTARLEEAVAAFRAALEEYTRERVPLQLGDDAEQSRQRAASAWRAGERHGAAGGGGRRLSRGAEGADARARAAEWATTQNNLGTALRRSASGRAARRGWRRRSPPIARR